MRQWLCVMALATALGASAHDARARQSGHNSGHHASQHGGHARSGATAAPAASLAAAGGMHSSSMHPLPASGYPRFRYYCPEVNLYYPDILICPSGFRGLPE